MRQVSLSIVKILNFFPIIFKRMATHTRCTQLLNCGRSSRRQLGVQLHCSSFHVYRRVWLPHLGQRLSMEREHGRACLATAKHRKGTWKCWRSFFYRCQRAMTLELMRMSTIMLFHGWSLHWRWRAMHEWVKGCLHCKGQYRVLSRLHCLHNILMRDLFAFAEQPY